jgi:GNAT superfamily N-acetyltransferase
MAKSPRRSFRSSARKALHQGIRRALALLPRDLRFAFYRRLVDCDPSPDPRLKLKIAETREELEACFAILHDAYVASGFMKPDPSGLRVTIYHALPTTTTLCATYDGAVVGTLSIVREGVFGFPLQSVFDLTRVRAREGHIAEISSLAVHPDFRRTGGAVMFPLMKFMYAYCTRYFDTRHLIIAVNPNRIEMYESLLMFERLQQHVVDNYDFANGAPAVGATLDLQVAPTLFKHVYGSRPPRRNLHHYFVELELPNIIYPPRRYFTTNDPVMTPALLDYFFNQRTRVFDTLDERKRALLHSIYDLPDYRAVLPPVDTRAGRGLQMRRHQRYSLRCPAHIDITLPDDGEDGVDLQVIEVSLTGFQAESKKRLPLNVLATAHVRLGVAEEATVRAQAVRFTESDFSVFYGFQITDADPAWKNCVSALESGRTYGDLH